MTQTGEPMLGSGTAYGVVGLEISSVLCFRWSQHAFYGEHCRGGALAWPVCIDRLP